MRPTKLLVALMPALLLSACATARMGRDFDLSAFDSKVQQGVTTQAEVRAWLGEPTGIGTSVDTGGQRYEEWTFYYGEGRFPDMTDARLKILQIKFDQRGVVRAYNWSGERK
jgi:outer membrane protein assembly factor BamE (lipoprotein component of BamABCDE complex)